MEDKKLFQNLQRSGLGFEMTVKGLTLWALALARFYMEVPFAYGTVL
jgi:hypothetical protein